MQTRLVSTVFILSVAVIVCACSSIPLSTMLKMRDFDETTLLAASSDEIRTRVTLDQGVAPDLEKMRLLLSLDLAKGERQFSFQLAMFSQRDYLQRGGFFQPDIARSEYVMKLTADSELAFQSLQRLIADESPNGLGVSLKIALDDDQKRRSGVINVEIQIEQQDGYFTLIDDYHYTIGEKREI